MNRHHFGISGVLTLLLVVLGLSISALANAAISLDTTNYTTGSSTGGTGTITLSATSGDTVFLAEYNDAGVIASTAPTMTGQTWTELDGMLNGWYPLGVTVWYTVLSSSGGTVTFTIPSDGGMQTVDVLVTLDAYSGVSSVDSYASHWGKQYPGPGYCDITPSYNNSLVLGFTAYGPGGGTNPSPDAGFTETESYTIGLANQSPPQVFVSCLNQYSTGNPSGTQVDVDSTPGVTDEAYSEIAVACH